jgi:hypothetical protein
MIRIVTALLYAASVPLLAVVAALWALVIAVVVLAVMVTLEAAGERARAEILG